MMDGGDAHRQPLELELPVAVESVERVRQAVLHWLGDAPLPPRVLTNVELVIEEVVMNLVLHAFDDPRGQCFRLDVRQADRELQLGFEDRGRDFDPAVAAPAPAAASQSESRVGGLGLPLLRKRTLWMRHTRRDGCNRLVIAVALSTD